MDNKQRIEALKRLLEARKIFYSLEMDDAEIEWDEQCSAYYEEYEEPLNKAKSFEEFSKKVCDFEQNAPPPPEGYDEWITFGTSVDQIARIYDGMIDSILEDLQEPTLEDVVEKFSYNTVGLSDNGLSTLFEEIVDTESSELMKVAAIWNMMEYNAKEMLEIDVISMLGEAYGKLGIPVEELPEIGIQDTIFLRGYLSHFPKNEQTIIKEGAPEYGQYMKLYNLVERVQREQDLKHQKEEQDDLKGRTGKILEAEALVDQQHGQQQE